MSRVKESLPEREGPNRTQDGPRCSWCRGRGYYYEHLGGCPRHQFWDGGSWQVPCHCSGPHYRVCDCHAGKRLLHGQPEAKS